VAVVLAIWDLPSGVLTLVVITAWVAVFILRRAQRERERRVAAVGGQTGAARSRTFGRKIAWLAIRATDAQSAADALQLVGQQPVAWADGVEATYKASTAGSRSRNKVFVTPPVDGWVLALLSDSEEAAATAESLARLSTQFGEVQRFASHRFVSYVEWQLWINGQPVRRWAYDGSRDEILLDDGGREPVEVGAPSRSDLDALYERLDHRDLDDPLWDQMPGDEEQVFAVAAAWSVNPETFDDRDDLADTGILGFQPVDQREDD
jgi:hypothetical protein